MPMLLWIVANIMYLPFGMIFFLDSLVVMLVPAPVTSEKRAEEGKQKEEKEEMKKLEERRKKEEEKQMEKKLEERMKKEEEEQMEKKRKEEEEEEKKKTRQINIQASREPSVNFSELRVRLLRQRLGTDERESERLSRSLEIKQREVEERERESDRKKQVRRKEALSIMTQQQQLEDPQGMMDMGLAAPELRFGIVADEERSREDKARRRQERVRRRHEEVRRRQERVMDQEGLLRTAFFP